MASGFGERQRVEEFARLLDGLDDASGSGVATLDAERPATRPIPSQRLAAETVEGLDDELATMLRAVEAVITLGEVHPPTPRPEFVESLGRRLETEFATQFGADGPTSGGNGGEPIGRHRTAAAAWRRRLLSGGLVIGVASGGIGGVAWAASGALPGDPLYGVKRSLENMRVSVSGSDLERGQQYLGQASTRLAEVHHLLDRKDANVDGTEPSKLIASTMDTLYNDVDNAGQLLVPLAEHGDAKALQILDGFDAAHEPGAEDLEVLLAPESRDKARRLATLMQGFDTRLAAAKTAIDKAAAAAKSHPGSPSTSAGHASATDGPTPSASPSATDKATPGPNASRAGTMAPGSGPKSDAPGNPSTTPTTDPTVNVQVPFGSPATTVVVPPLISGLPPIGITLGNTAPATGPTSDAGPPNTDPNPN